MQKKSIRAVLAVVSVLFVCNLSMFAQVSQSPRRRRFGCRRTTA